LKVFYYFLYVRTNLWHNDGVVDPINTDSEGLSYDSVVKILCSVNLVREAPIIVRSHRRDCCPHSPGTLTSTETVQGPSSFCGKNDLPATEQFDD